MGEYTFTVLVEDYGGNKATKSVKYTVLHPPIANAGSDQNTFERESITFDGTGSTDPDGDIVSYAWNFGNGMSGAGINPSHTYTLAGEKIVTLTVTDDGGLTGTDIAIIIVKTPTGGTHDLNTKVDEMGLPLDIDKGLMGKLTAAQTLIAQKKYTPARQTPLVFINQVNSQREKTLTTALVDELISIAQRMLNSISGL